MNPKAMFNISYGLYVLTANLDGKDNGCIINTVTQVTSDPNQISIAVNKLNHTRDMIAASKKFTASIISQNYGAGKYKRVLDAFFSVLAVNVVIGAVISGLEIWQMDFFAGLFDSGSIEFHEMIKLVYRYEALGAVPLGLNASVLALLYGLGKTKLTLVINFSRVFAFRIPVFWYLQHYTNYGEASVGIVMMVSNICVTLLSSAIAFIVIRNFTKSTGI